MQIAKSLNYKMRCKGSLKTPPTRIKCIIFFILAEHQVCAFYTVGKNWEKIPMIQDPQILVKTQFELQFTEVKKKCDTFLSVFVHCEAWRSIFSSACLHGLGGCWSGMEFQSLFFYHLRRFAPQQRNIRRSPSRIFCNTQNNLLSLFWVVVALHICRSSHCSNWLLARRTKGVSFSEENDGRPADTAHSRRASTETKRSTKSNCSNKNFI